MPVRPGAAPASMRRLAVLTALPLLAATVLVPRAAQAEKPEPDVGIEIAIDVGEPEGEPAATSAPADAPPSEEEAEGAASDAKPPIELTIVGTRLSQTPGSAHVIRSRALERFEYDDPQAVLQSVPGVFVRGEDGVGLRPNVSVRGVNPDRSKKVALMEDGIPFAPAPYSAPAAYYFPLITRMTQVRVIKGPSAISYGPQTIGGSVDLLTRAVPAVPTGAIDAAVGEYGYTKLHGHFGSSDERSGFLIEGVHLGSTGFKELPSGADTGYARNEWMFKGYTRFGEHAFGRHELRLKLTYSDEISNETYLGLSDADFRRNPLQRYAASQLDRMQWHRTSIVLAHVLEAAPGLTITTTGYRHDMARVWRKVNGFRGADVFDVLTETSTPQNALYHAILKGEADTSTPGEVLRIGPNQRDFVSQGVETRVRWDTTTGPLAHRIEYGLRLHQDRVERRHSEDGFLVRGGELVPEGSATKVTAFNEASTEALALHAIDAVTYDRLTLTPGIRLEVFRSTTRDRIHEQRESRLSGVVLPGLGAYYALTRDLGVLAGAYRGFSPPAPGSSEDVEPELGTNYEAGARFSTGALRAEVIGFYNDYTNLTDVCTLSSGCVEENLDSQFDAGEARIYGLEAFVDHELALDSVTVPLSASYTLTFAEFQSTFRSDDPIFQPSRAERSSGLVQPGDELPYVPRHQLNVSLGIEHAGSGAVLGLTYVSSMREQPGKAPLSETLHTDEQLVLDAGGKIGITSWLTAYVNVRNLLDGQFIVSRRPYGARPNAPRWFQLGLKAEL